MTDVTMPEIDDTPSAPAQPQRLIRIHKVAEKVALHRATIYRMIRSGDFPRQRQVGQGVAWIESEIDAWIMKLPVKDK